MGLLVAVLWLCAQTKYSNDQAHSKQISVVWQEVCVPSGVPVFVERKYTHQYPQALMKETCCSGHFLFLLSK